MRVGSLRRLATSSTDARRPFLAEVMDVLDALAVALAVVLVLLAAEIVGRPEAASSAQLAESGRPLRK